MNGELKWFKENLWKVLGAIFIAGGIAWQVKANTEELANRRSAVDSIPHLQKDMDDIEEKLDKILCRLGDITACPPGKK